MNPLEGLDSLLFTVELISVRKINGIEGMHDVRCPRSLLKLFSGLFANRWQPTPALLADTSVNTFTFTHHLLPRRNAPKGENGLIGGGGGGTNAILTTEIIDGIPIPVPPIKGGDGANNISITDPNFINIIQNVIQNVTSIDSNFINTLQNLIEFAELISFL